MGLILFSSINDIETFWGFAKTTLRYPDGIRRSHVVLDLKEMEFRFNCRHEDLPRLIERILKTASSKLDELQKAKFFSQ